MIKYWQAGDILFKEATFLTIGLKLVKSNIIKLGSASGHAHTLSGGKLYQDKNNNMFIVAGKDTSAEHDEHKSIALPVGKYRVDVVKEFDHFLEESKQVQD